MKINTTKKKSDEYLDKLTNKRFNSIFPSLEKLVGFFFEKDYFKNFPEPAGIDKLVELTNKENAIILASSHGTMVDPGIAGVPAFRKRGLIFRYAGGSKWYFPLFTGFMRSFGSIKTPELGKKNGKSDMEAYLTSIVSRLIDGSIDGRSVPIWIAVPAGRSRDGTIQVNPIVVKTFIIFAEMLYGKKELYIVPNDILTSPSPDQFSMERTMEIKAEKSSLSRSIRYLFNELKHYLFCAFSKEKIKAHVSYSEPINLTRMLTEKYGMNEGRISISEKRRASEDLSEIIRTELLNGAVIFENYIPSALLAYAANSRSIGPLQKGSSGELSVKEAVVVANRWISGLDSKNLHSDIDRKLTEADVIKLFNNMKRVASIEIKNNNIYFSQTTFVASYRVNAFNQLYSHLKPSDKTEARGV